VHTVTVWLHKQSRVVRNLFVFSGLNLLFYCYRTSSHLYCVCALDTFSNDAIVGIRFHPVMPLVSIRPNRVTMPDHYLKILRRPQNRKSITYCTVVKERYKQLVSKLSQSLDMCVSEMCERTDRHTDTLIATFCTPLEEYNRTRHNTVQCFKFPLVYSGGSVVEWLACWTQAQKGPVSNRSRDAVGQQS